MNIIGDFHTHTSVSQHAYSTINEMVLAAKRKDLKAIAITNHGPETLDGAMLLHFLCLSDLPDEVDGIRLLKGAEANITNFTGSVDISASIINRLDFIIGSYHIETIKSGSIEENTRGWVGAIQSGLIDCLGHSGNPVFPFDHEVVVKECAKWGVAIEVNANSPLVRPGSEKNCKEIIELCLRYNVPLFVNSDAHSMYSVGEFAPALKIINSMNVPQEAVVNTSFEAVMQFVEKRKAQRRAK